MPLLQIEGLSRRFGGLCAVQDFSLELETGALAGLIGPNGAGKTTVFNLLTGVYPPTGGRILFRGQSIGGRAPARIVAMGIARTFQNIRLFQQLSVLDNIRVAQYAQARYGPLEALLHIGRYHREERRLRARAHDLLERCDLGACAPDPARQLPYGLQRRLEIARALATGPALLLLDEPAAGMNPREVDDLAAFLRKIRLEFGLTILLIEHHMQMVMELCEQITVMNFGAVLARGEPREIQGHPAVQEAYLGKEVP